MKSIDPMSLNAYELYEISRGLDESMKSKCKLEEIPF